MNLSHRYITSRFLPDKAIDLIDEAGSAANLKNVKLVNIDSAARTAALASKRVDVVFWYEVDKTSEFQADIPDGVIISEPYYEWEKFIHVKKALKKTQSSQNWNINRSIMEMFFSW